MKRYYYKNSEGTRFFNLKSPKDDENYIPITEEEYIELTKLPEPSEKQKTIAEAKEFLARTDYIVMKLAEAQADGDTAKVGSIKSEYSFELSQRKLMRTLINSLEV